MFALLDCNNFYASCERLFRPDLQGLPLVVLSNNDGCVIARSEEAKALGIRMGEPFFQIQSLCKQHRVEVFSSNYTLYADLSARVMSVIESSWAAVEIYSIDEAFLDLTAMPESRVDAFCTELQKRVVQWTGIPVSIGIGKTKTLAKAANNLAKKTIRIPVFNLTRSEDWLSGMDVGDVWGIGRKWVSRLMQRGIRTAADLARCNPHEIKREYNVILMRTVLELQGISCLSSESGAPHKNILASRSFGSMQTEYEILAEAIGNHAARACEKARRQGSVVQRMQVFIRSNRHRQDLPQYARAMECQLISPTDDSRILIKMAKICLQKIYRPGIQYKKVGVILMDLVEKRPLQRDLFHQHSDETLAKRERLMGVLDAVNYRYGSHTLTLAAAGTGQSWKMRRERVSPAYTTRWADLPVVRTG